MHVRYSLEMACAEFEWDEDEPPGPGTIFCLRISFSYFAGAYALPSSFGPQMESKVPSSPCMSFRSKSGWDKVTISKEHMLEFQGLDSPGPACYETVSPRFSAGVKFSRSSRPSSLFPDTPERTPGSVYEQDSRLVHRSLIVGRFTQSPRESRYIRCSSMLGPGQYEWEKSSLSRRACSFGESYTAYANVYFKGKEREQLGRTCPVLGTYRTTCISPRGVTFPRSNRDDNHSLYMSSVNSARRRSLSPLGPGSYAREESRVKPSVRFGPRPEKVKPRLDLKKISKIPKKFWDS